MDIGKFASEEKTTALCIWIVAHEQVVAALYHVLRERAKAAKITLAAGNQPIEFLVEGTYGKGAKVVPYVEYQETHALELERKQLQLTEEIQNLLARHVKRIPPKVYEMNNILERWLVSMANEKPEVKPDDVKEVLWWSPIYWPMSITHVLNAKFMQELTDKKLVKNALEAKKLVGEILTLVQVQLERGASTHEVEVAPLCEDEWLRYGDVKLASSPKHNSLVDLYGCYPVVRAAMRYASIINGGQQWGLTQAHADDLYKDFDVRNESFASPFNSRFVGKEDARFGSLFYDTDAVFGSMGNFFKIDLLDYPGAWQVNPPFIESLLAAATEKVLAALASAEKKGQALHIFFLTPAWLTAKYYLALVGSKYMLIQTKLRKGHYHFELPNGSRFVARIDCGYFFLSSTALTAASKAHVTAMMGRLNSPAPL
ncbi:Phosphorylated CTD interacting factor 1 WW domain-containing protein [uncultured virus]|nr:Phosphorylated CTD interacting factor 1 WW domain-containing protein [uncultured virus]